jgi:glutamyl-tRNA reductase
MPLVLLGIDFRQAALDLRAALSYDVAATRALLARTSEIPGLREAAVLSTCNRTEFYLVVEDGSDAATRWLHLLRQDRAHARVHDPACLLVRHEGDAAAAHLFSVAAGLASALLGDTHVAGQVKQAYAVATDAGTVGPVLHRTFQQALRVARRTRRETAIGRGHVSIGACVAQLLAHVAPQATRVSVLGTGTVATDVSRHLAKRGGLALTIAGRDPGRTAALAAHVGAAATNVDQLEGWLSDADIVIGATAASAPVLTAAMVAAARPDPGPSAAAVRAPLLICDLGVPRNVAADVAATLFTIDDIRARRDAALAVREAAVPAAQDIVATAVRAWRAWKRERVLVPTIVTLFAREQERRQAMAARLATRTGEPVARLDGRLRRTGRQLVHRHVVALRACAAGSPGAPAGSASRHVTVQG